VFAVVLLVHIQGLAGLATVTETTDGADYGRLAWYLAIGAVVQLLSTLAVTEATRTIGGAAAREAEHHNFLAGQRRAAEKAVPASSDVSSSPAPRVEGLPDGRSPSERVSG